MRQREDEVLVEEHEHENRYADSALPPVHKQQPLQVLEAPNCVVSSRGRLVPFISKNSHAYVRLLNHIDVVGPVPDSERDCLGILLADDLDNLRLLGWGGAAYNDRLAVP